MKNISRKNIVVVMSMLLVLMSAVIIGATTTGFSLYTFYSGDTISSSQVNANFQAISNQLPSATSNSYTTTGLGLNTLDIDTIVQMTPAVNGVIIASANIQPTFSAGTQVTFNLGPSDIHGNLTANPWSFFATASYLNINIAYPAIPVVAGTTYYFTLSQLPIAVTNPSTSVGTVNLLFIPTK